MLIYPNFGHVVVIVVIYCLRHCRMPDPDITFFGLLSIFGIFKERKNTEVMASQAQENVSY